MRSSTWRYGPSTSLGDEAEEAFKVDDWDVADKKIDVRSWDGAVDSREQL